MRRTTAALTITLAVVCAAALAAQSEGKPDRQLRTRIEQRYDIVPLTDGIALRPKSASRDVRLIEIAAGGVISINGVAVTGRELRERVGSDADLILRLSYMTSDERREFLAMSEQPAESPAQTAPEPPASPAVPEPTEEPSGTVARRTHGDRVRIFGSVTVPEGEEVTGQAVAVMGSVRVDGQVDDQVLAVLGSVTLGPHAIVRGDVVAVGGRVIRAEGSQVGGGVTEVSMGELALRSNRGDWAFGHTPLWYLVGFGAVPRLIGSMFHFLLLAMFASLAFIVARGAVEGAAERASTNPVKSTAIGFAAEVLLFPALLLTSIVLAISIIGIPLLFLIPFALFALVLIALAGFSGTAFAVGRWARGRFGLAYSASFLNIVVGVFLILFPLLVGRVVALAGWPASPFAGLLLATGIGLEFLAWTCGFGAMLENGVVKWQARRAARAPSATPPPVVP
jgi:hypothetical protein